REKEFSATAARQCLLLVSVINGGKFFEVWKLPQRWSGSFARGAPTGGQGKNSSGCSGEGKNLDEFFHSNYRSAAQGGTLGGGSLLLKAKIKPGTTNPRSRA
ncbi:MAG: hypothetical protein MK312_16060, partial [Roseibacillus sp.]|nr:hypothetical protein [Roseibacillus sp.]